MRRSRLLSLLPAPLLLVPPLIYSFSSTAFASPVVGSSFTIDGVKIETTHMVSCVRKSQKGDALVVNYRGTLVDGTEFDSSYKRHRPFHFKLGVGNVIQGWDIGMMDMCPGEERRLTIPPEMAYGNRDKGAIPPGSTLVFVTELLEIEGVPKENEPAIARPAGATEPGVETVGEEKDGDNQAKVSGEEPPDNGECRLLGPFAILVQGALGGLALLSLVYKRWRERPQRPFKIWFFDVSKQVFGSVLVHIANLFMSMLSSGDLDVQKTSTFVQQDPMGRQPNPCSFYLLNLAIDTTVGIPILVLLLRVLHGLFVYTPLANPPESLKSGNYGHPPRASWWLKQSIIYFIGLLGMKLCVFALFQLFPFLGWVGDWALRWTEGKEWVQITFVMLIFPLVMNAAQYYIIDSFIKDPAGSYDAVQNAEDEAEEHEGLIRQGRQHDDDAADADEDSYAEERRNTATAETKTAEPNPTPLPAYRHSARPGSSSVGSKSPGDEEDDKR